VPDPTPPPSNPLTRPLQDLSDPLPIPCLSAERGRPPPLARLKPPGSKSLTNRALLLAALARGSSRIHRPLLGAEDTERMAGALQQLGATIRESGGSLIVEGVGDRWRPKDGEVRLDLENAGTAVRFLAAAAALSPRTGHHRRQRTHAAAPDRRARRGAGGTERAGGVSRHGGVPAGAAAASNLLLPRAATIELPTTLSSQFISALLLIAPWLPGGLTLKLDGEITSRSYIQMTIGILDVLGASVRSSDSLQIIRVAGPDGGGLSRV
jgi:3-phosphoshikimate 1-carboxyvinyltransferase